MRKLLKGELASRRVLNGTKRMSGKAIQAANEMSLHRQSAEELQGRIKQQRLNDSITMFSED